MVLMTAILENKAKQIAGMPERFQRPAAKKKDCSVEDIKSQKIYKKINSGHG